MPTKRITMEASNDLETAHTKRFTNEERIRIIEEHLAATMMECSMPEPSSKLLEHTDQPVLPTTTLNGACIEPTLALGVHLPIHEQAQDYYITCR